VMLVNSDSNLDHNDDVSVCSDDNSNTDSNSNINDDLMQVSITQNLYFKDTSLSSLPLMMFSKSSIFSLSK